MADNQCTTCDEGTGYLWDSASACPDCAKGRAIQYRYDLAHAKGLRARLRRVNKRIKAYEAQEDTEQCQTRKQ